MRRRLAYSLLELTLALGIMALVGSLGLLALNRTTSTAGSRGLAEGLAEELRSTRQMAVARSVPVALCLANEGNLFTTRTFYRALGMRRATPQPPRAFGAEFAGSFLYFGRWSGPSFTTTEPVTGSAADRFQLDNWLSSLGSTVPALVFFPSGRVRARNVPYSDGQYCLLAVQGVAPTGGDATAVYSPYTVGVSPMGDVVVTKGARGGVAGLTREGATAAPPLATVSWTQPVNNPPVIRDVAVLPRTNVELHTNPGEYATSDSITDLYPEQSDNNHRNWAPVTLVVYATDPDNDPLTFRWRSTPLGGAAQGAFTYPEAGRMSWDAANSLNLGTCTWLPPPDGNYNTHQWQLHVKVDDGRGGSADSSTLAQAKQPTIELDHPGKVGFDKYDYGTGWDAQEAVFTMNIDGMAPTRITNLPDVNENKPDMSPAGDWVAFCSTQLGSWEKSDIWICTTDGHKRINLTNTDDREEIFPKWSPDGGMIAFYSKAPGDDRYQVRVIEAHATGGGAGYTPGKLVSGGHKSSWKQCPPTWDPTSKYLAFIADDGDEFYSHLILSRVLDGALIKRVRGGDDPANGYYDVTTAAWSPRGDHIAFTDYWSNRIHLVLVDDNPVRDPLDDDNEPGTPGYDPSLPTDVNRNKYSKLPQLLFKNNPDVTCYLENEMPPMAWSRGGTTIIACVDRNKDGNYELRRLTRTDTDPPNYDDPGQRLTNASLDCVQPCYSAGGGYIVMAGKRSDGTEPIKLYRIPANAPDSDYPMGSFLLNEVTKYVWTHSVSR